MTSAVVTSSLGVGGASATALRVGKPSAAVTNQRRPEPPAELALSSNDNLTWDYDIGNCFDDDEYDWPDTSSLQHKNNDDRGAETYSVNRQQYVFQPRRSLMKWFSFVSMLQ